LQLLPYQRRWVEDDSPLKLVVKARQIGYSFAASIRALLECLKKKTTWVFLSKGERQSRLLMEKVQEHVQSCGILARACESSFFEGTLIKQLEVRFANGSVIYGLPANPDTARGYSGNVTLDEFAFHSDADKIYSALFPTITRGYSLEIISTPNGQQGKFYELAKAAGLVESGDRVMGRSGDRSGDREIGRSGEQGAAARCGSTVRAISPWSDLPIIGSPDHPITGSSDHPIIGSSDHPITRSSDHPISRSPDHPIWSGHCVDIYEAIRQGLQIDLRLLRAGCDDETAWQQEYCCQFVSTAENFIPPALVAQCASAEAAKDCPPQVLASAPLLGLGPVGAVREPPLQPGSGAVVSVGAVPEPPLPDGEFYLGIDIGRHHDRTVFWVDRVTVGPSGARPADRTGAPWRAPTEPDDARPARDGGRAPLGPTTDDRVAVARMVRTFANTPFAEQLAFARELLSLAGPSGRPLIRRACIDSTGMGAPLAESLEREFGPRVEPVTFTAAAKEDMAYRVKRRMEQRLDLIPDAPEIARAFGAVKKLVTVAGNTRFDAERTDLGHADEFWAKALADLAAEQPTSHLSDGVIVGTPRAAVWLPAALPRVF
jgi:phage FluMu gp28-like protein